jgi:hypothetical protein
MNSFFDCYHRGPVIQCRHDCKRLKPAISRGYNCIFIKAYTGQAIKI